MTMIDPMYSLSEAVEKFFPPDSTGKRRFSVRSLRTEIKNGNLVPIRFAGKISVTESILMEMLDRCREKPKVPASGSGQAEKIAAESGSSSTAEAKSALDAAKASVAKLKKHSQITSPASTKSRKQAGNLIELSSRTS